MGTKLDFKIKTALDKYDVIGSGDMIYTACQIGEWWVVPAKDYKGDIPIEAQKKLADFFKLGIEIKGILVADDIRNVKCPPKGEEVKPKPQKANNAGLEVFMTILAVLGLGLLYLLQFAFSYDPMLIAVLPDGRWICLASWYE